MKIKRDDERSRKEIPRVAQSSENSLYDASSYYSIPHPYWMRFYRGTQPDTSRDRARMQYYLWTEPQVEELDKTRCAGGLLTYLIFSAFLLILCMQVDHYVEIDLYVAEKWVYRAVGLGLESFYGRYSVNSVKFDVRNGDRYEYILDTQNKTASVTVPSVVGSAAQLWYRRDVEWMSIGGGQQVITLSTHFPLGIFTYYMLQAVLGFTFVNLVNLNNYRKNPFFSRKDRDLYSPYYITNNKRGDYFPIYSEFRTHMVVQLLNYLVTGSVTLKNRYSMYHFCRLNPSNTDTCGNLAENPQDFGMVSDWTIFTHNFFFWTLFYYGLGLQWSFFDRTDLGRFNLTLSSLQGSDVAIIIALGSGALIIAAILSFTTWLYWLSGPLVLLFYFLYGVAVTVLLLVLTLWVYPIKEFHFHHWSLFLLLSTFLCHQNPVVSAMHALCIGTFTEGIARYGYDPVYKSLYL